MNTRFQNKVAVITGAAQGIGRRVAERMGEEGGRLDTLLVHTADIYGREVRTAVKRLISIMEPAMILFLGALIAAIILSVLVAITGLYDLAL